MTIELRSEGCDGTAYKRGGVVKGQHVQRLGDERDRERLDRRPGGWSRESRGEHGKTGERGRGGTRPCGFLLVGLRVLTFSL